MSGLGLKCRDLLRTTGFFRDESGLRRVFMWKALAMWLSGHVWYAINNQLRTGTDWGNPTV